MPGPTVETTPRVLFVNGGILGLRTFHEFVTAMLPGQDRIRGETILLTADLTLTDRVIRRILCQSVWPDGLFGLRNLDYARYRRELHAGVLARRRIAALWNGGVDVLHFHRQATASASIGLMRRVPAIVTMDCTQRLVMDAAGSAAERTTYRANLRRDGKVFAAASAVVAISKWAADQLHAEYPECRTPVHVMPNPVMLAHFDPGWAEVRRRRAAAGGRPKFLFMGGDFPRKGGPALLEAWMAGRFAARATLDVVTDWPVPEPLPEGVRIIRGVTAHSPAWIECWAGADAFVMPTTNEAFGLVFQEAAAASLPAIGTNLNAVPEIIEDQVTGLLVPPGDREALVRAMDQLIGSASLREAMGLRARRKIEATADPVAHFERTIELILQVWRRGPMG